MTERQRLESFGAMLDAVELTSVRFLEVCGRVTEDATSPTAAKSIPIEAQAETSEDGDSLRVRARTIDSDTMEEFLRHSAMPTLAPFLREALVTTAARLEVDPPMLRLWPQPMPASD